MSTRKQAKAVQNLINQICQLSKHNPKKEIKWLLRSLLVNSKSSNLATSGFVLPTAVLLLLVVSLTVAALLVRSLGQTNQVFSKRQQQEIYNAATPAIDRAKSKLEFMFTKDGRYPGGVPPEEYLADTMLASDNYKFRDETRLDLNRDGIADNAWVYSEEDPNNPGSSRLIAYSIMMKTANATNTVTLRNSDTQKAAAMVVRTGPLNTVSQTTNNCRTNTVSASNVENGWFNDSNSAATLRKNFQVNAVVLENPNTNTNRRSTLTPPYATLELQQERQVDRGNKWGAWFRNDLEIFAGPAFRWNGAMHTEGSLFLGNGTFNAYLISSPASCLYGSNGLDASQLTLSEKTVTRDDGTNEIVFQGQIASAKLNDNSFANNSSRIDQTPNSFTTLTSGNDSSTRTDQPIQIALDPLSIFTENKSVARNTSDRANTSNRDSGWQNSSLATGNTARVFNRNIPTPYVDDTYRADNRYGPKLLPPKEPNIIGMPPGKKVGNLIESGDNFSAVTLKTFEDITRNDPPPGNPEGVGLDGYWERRARNQGLRVIVGQRLELGSPLAIPSALAATRPHEALQRRTLRDNLAAVQSTAIYFQDPNPDMLDVPVACLATTVHPGTAETLKRSATFQEVSFNNSSGSPVTSIYNDFFTGRGTNGWEYGFHNRTTFTTRINDSNSALRKALQNLAYFAGDPDGAFPAKQERSTSNIVHPYPELIKYGDFSNLRRALRNFQTPGVTYDNLSIADKSYIATATCSLGMLADQIKVLQDFDYTKNTGLLGNVNLAMTTVGASIPNLDKPEAAMAVLNLGYQRVARAIYVKEQIEYARRKGIGYTCGFSAVTYPKLAQLCADASNARYDALYYLFPTTDHAENRADTNEYISSSTNSSKGINPTSLTTLYKTISNTDLNNIQLVPRPISNWVLPSLDVTSTYASDANAPNNRQFELIKFTNNAGIVSFRRIPFKDTALFNGREMMNVRVLNLDLDLLRRNNDPDTADAWLPASGIIYAFREDAVREDGIARPAISTWDAYKTAWDANTNSGPLSTSRMDARPGSPKDPPVNGLQADGTISAAGTGISPKPIDYYADPDRRPYGFRLKNGREIVRTNANNDRGLSFISDNPVYIQGDFNWHQNAGGTRLEEFSQFLQDDWSNFYNRTNRDAQFATDADRWRPTEIIADAITILSDSFCDGSVQDGFFVSGTGLPSSTGNVDIAQYGCGTGNGVTSYLNQNRIDTSIVYGNWLRENPPDQTSPIVINPNGAPVIGSTPPTGVTYTILPGTAYTGSYQIFDNNKTLSTPGQTRVNAILVSGLVPSRVQQSFGGLHNFPRFLQSWSNVPLYISGSLIQLNYSAYATAPFDQDAWERDQDPQTTEMIRYYGAPNRLWGYDVGLQYRPPGAVARRFTSPSTNRSEFYKELPVDDPYILRLRCATQIGNSQRVDPRASCS